MLRDFAHFVAEDTGTAGMMLGGNRYQGRVVNFNLQVSYWKSSGFILCVCLPW